MFQIESFMTNGSSSETAENNLREVRPSTAVEALVKLPISFDGEPENWHTFIDSFECAIDKSDTLSGIQKTNYLRNFVEGKAATITSSIKLANENYNMFRFTERKIRRQTINDSFPHE